MQCPACHTVDLEQLTIDGTRVDTCPQCGGIWFDNGELRSAKDARLKDFAWFDLDLWKNDADFFGEPSGMTCPTCEPDEPLVTIRYDSSPISIDVCENCHGIWLDRAEFDALLSHIEGEAEHEVLANYRHALTTEIAHLFTAEDQLRHTHLRDVLTLVDLFKYKFMVQHDKLARLFIELPR